MPVMQKKLRCAESEHYNKGKIQPKVMDANFVTMKIKQSRGMSS